MKISRLVLALPLLALTGCLVMSNNEEHRSGKYVADSTFTQIEPGKTTGTWVLATLGEPSTKTKAEKSEVWKYDYSEVKESGNAILFIFLSKNTRQSSGTAFIEIKDGVVANAWRG